MSTKEKLIALWAGNKKVILILVAGAVVIGGAAGVGYNYSKNNSKKADTMFTQKADNGDKSAEQGETELAPPAEEEIVSFKDKDKDLNSITLTPIFNDDGIQIIAGYILEAFDKNGNKLTAEQYPLLGSVVSATRNGNNGMVVVDADKNMIPMETLSNESGDLIAIKDVMDLDGDKDMDEYFKLVHTVDANGIKKILIEYTNVEVKTDEDDNKVVISDGTQIKAEVVDKDNKNVANKEQQEVKKNESTKEKVKKEQDKNPTSKNDKTTTSANTTTLPGAKDDESTTKPGATTTTKAPSKPGGTTTTTKPTEPTKPEQTTAPDDNDIAIVLKENSQAECKSSGVEIDTTGLIMKDTVITITEPGDYVFTSEIKNNNPWRGSIQVKVPSNSKTSIKFRGVNIINDTENIIRIINTDANEDMRNKFLDTEVETKYGENEPTFDDLFANFSDLDTEDVPEVTLSFPVGTSNTFKTDSKKVTGVLYNESKLKIKGNGEVLFESTKNYNNCICSTKSITIENCTVTLRTANCNVPDKIAASNGAAKGIFSYGRVTVESGTLDIKSNGDAIRCSRFFAKGGTMNIVSSACDAFDVDSEIKISDGVVNAIALKKSCFKVRAVNNNGGEYSNKSGTKDYTFKITGGTVVGEGSKSTLPQQSSTQPSIRTYIGQYRAAEKNSKKQLFFPGVQRNISIMSGKKTIKSSANKCTTFLYSSSSLNAEDGKYKMFTSVIPEGRGDVHFTGNVGEAFYE